MKNLLYAILAISAAYIYFNYFGERPEKLIADVTLTSNGKNKNLAFDFTTPIRYLGHFPESYGEVLQIRFRSISFSGFEQNYSILNDIIKAGSTAEQLIDDVRYEGDVPGGPFVIVRFTKPVEYEIHEGEGLRSLSISFTDDAS